MSRLAETFARRTQRDRIDHRYVLSRGVGERRGNSWKFRAAWDAEFVGRDICVGENPCGLTSCHETERVGIPTGPESRVSDYFSGTVRLGSVSQCLQRSEFSFPVDSRNRASSVRRSPIAATRQNYGIVNALRSFRVNAPRWIKITTNDRGNRLELLLRVFARPRRHFSEPPRTRRVCFEQLAQRTLTSRFFSNTEYTK